MGGTFKGARLAWDLLSKCLSASLLLDSCGLVETEAAGEPSEGKFLFNWRSATAPASNDFTNVLRQHTHSQELVVGAALNYFHILMALEDVQMDSCV